MKSSPHPARAPERCKGSPDCYSHQAPEDYPTRGPPGLDSNTWGLMLGWISTPACCRSLAPNRSLKESTCLLAACLAGPWLALGEADVVLSGLEGLQPPLHVLLEDLLVLSLLRVLQDEVAAAAGFVLAMTAPPCHEAGCLGLPQESQATAPQSP